MARVLVYTSQFCGYCHAATRLLDSRKVKYSLIDVTNDPEARLRMEAESGGRKTVPQIFINGQGIGGYTELRALDRSGKLLPLVEGD